MKIPSLKSVRLSKTWFVLGVALLIGLVAALGAKTFLSNKIAEMQAKNTAEMVDFVVAKSDLPKGAVLTTDDVAVRPIPKTYAPATGVRPAEFSRADGEKLAYGVRRGEVILWGLLEGKKTPTFSAKIAVGRRAMTVPVDQINSISGLLDPGDHIDLMVTVERKDQKLTFPILQDVQVMATGHETIDSSNDGHTRTYDTVTLNVTPDGARNLIVARSAGKITALLRNPDDPNKFSSATVDLTALLGKTRQASGEAFDEQIPVLYGGTRGDYSASALNLQGHDRTPGTTQLPSPAMQPGGLPLPSSGGQGLGRDTPSDKIGLAQSPAAGSEHLNAPATRQ